MKTKEIKVQVIEYDNLNELSDENKDLLIQAREATQNAYAPYSGFFVGAAVLLENGKVVTGNNQENAAYPSGLCAERVALFYANANYPDVPVVAIAITAKNKLGKIHVIASPCGSCRQVMLETESRFEKPINVILDGEKIQMMEGIDNLLPLGFRPHSLK
ncbi:MAG: cytidine deaminase [Mariniphaga sp.]|nr:cytidine deaminase [Mariniphaga sp.]